MEGVPGRLGMGTTIVGVLLRPTGILHFNAPVRVEIYSSEETVEIFLEADLETLPERRRRFAILNIPRSQLSEATGAAARRAAKPA
jgi:hypothetical protein